MSGSACPLQLRIQVTENWDETVALEKRETMRMKRHTQNLIAEVPQDAPRLGSRSALIWGYLEPLLHAQRRRRSGRPVAGFAPHRPEWNDGLPICRRCGSRWRREPTPFG